MSYARAVKASEEIVPPEETRFCFPVPAVLESELVRLIPFDPSKHADEFIGNAGDTMFDYLPCGPFESGADMTENMWKKLIHTDDTRILFAVLDKTPAEGPRLAGVIGFLHTEPDHLATEIGFVLILPKFRRTHVTSHAVGILLHQALDIEGWGLRRVIWCANANNAKSVAAAERMGFQKEGVLRWARVLDPWKSHTSNGKPERKGDSKPGCTGRDTALLSLCWDDWENGGREKVDNIMARR